MDSLRSHKNRLVDLDSTSVTRHKIMKCPHTQVGTVHEMQVKLVSQVGIADAYKLRRAMCRRSLL